MPLSSQHNKDIVTFLKTPTAQNVLAMCRLIRVRDRPDTSKRRPAFIFTLQSGGPGGEEVHLMEIKRTFKGKHAYYTFQVRTHSLDINKNSHAYMHDPPPSLSLPHLIIFLFVVAIELCCALQSNDVV